LVTGGTSLVGANAAVKTTGPCVGLFGLLLPHAAPRIATAATIAYRFIVIVPLKSMLIR